jgi:hypothetical protein
MTDSSRNDEIAPGSTARSAAAWHFSREFAAFWTYCFVARKRDTESATSVPRLRDEVF